MNVPESYSRALEQGTLLSLRFRNKSSFVGRNVHSQRTRFSDEVRGLSVPKSQITLSSVQLLAMKKYVYLTITIISERKKKDMNCRGLGTPQQGGEVLLYGPRDSKSAWEPMK